MVVWNKTLETNMPKIDEQHKELFRQTTLLMNDDRHERVSETLDSLTRFVRKHFADEQVLHAVANYPKASEHKEMHQQFAQAFRRLRDEYEVSGHNRKTLMKLNYTVMGWLKGHIMIHDKEFAKYCKNT